MFKKLMLNKWKVTAISLGLVVVMLATIIGIPKINHGKVVETIGVVSASTTADYTCTGTNDNTQFVAALNALPLTGGEIDILSGNYNFAGTVTRAINNVTINGLGNATNISYNGSSPCFTAGGTGWHFENIKLDAGGISGTWTGANITVGATYWAIYGTGSFAGNLTGNVTGDVTGNVTGSAGTAGTATNQSGGTINATSGTVTTLTATTANISTLNAPTGRTGYVIVASDYTGTQYDQKLAGTNDQVAINAELVALNALGGTQNLSLVGDFTCNGVISAVSNVNVNLTGSVTVTSNSNLDIVDFNAITNSVWSGGTYYRVGTITGFVEGFSIVSCTSRTLVLKDLIVISQIVDTEHGAGEQNCGIRIDCSSPTMTNVTAHASQNDTAAQSAGIMLVNDDIPSQPTSPILNNCIGYAGGGDTSAGILIQSSFTNLAVLNNCIGYGNDFSNPGGSAFLSGIECWDGGSPTLNNCIGYGGGAVANSGYGYGLWIDGGSSAPIINGGQYYGGTGVAPMQNDAIYVGLSSAPTFNGTTGAPQRYSTRHWYAGDAGIGFKPFAGKAYMVLSMYIGSNGSLGGMTLDIGTTVGGHEIAQNLSIASYANPVPLSQAVQMDADALIYITPSGTVANGLLFVSYTVMYDSGYQQGLELNTSGMARFTNCSFYAGRYGNAVQIDSTVLNWYMTNCTLWSYEYPGWGFALTSVCGALTNVPCLNCTIYGKQSSITSFLTDSDNVIITS